MPPPSSASASLSHRPSHDGLPLPRRGFAIGLLLLSLTMVVLEGAIANVALPSIALSLQATPSDTVWVVSAYQLAVLVALLPCGALGEIFGARRVFLIGVVIFTLASAACAVATTLPVLVVARFLQGLGGGAIMALSIMNMRQAVPERLLGPIIGINAMVVAIASAAGPGLAGAILAVTSWPWLFAVNLPLGLLVLLGGGVLPGVAGVARPLKAGMFVANAAMFILFFSGADSMADRPLTGLLLIGAALACLIAMVRRERGSATPLIPTDLLGLPDFRVAVIASIACFTGQMLSYVALPFYLHHMLNMPPVMAGLMMMPWPIATAITAPIAGRLANRVKTAWLCAIGGGLLALGLLVAGLSPADPQAIAFLIGTVMAGAGFGLFQTPNNRILVLAAPRARSGAAGAMQGTARLTGQTLGGIIMSLLFAALPIETALTAAIVVASAYAALAGLVSLSRARFE